MRLLDGRAGAPLRLAVALGSVRRARRALGDRSMAEVLPQLRVPAATTWLGDVPVRWAASVDRASRILRADCMPRSVALARLLARSGHAVTLVLGARRDAAGAWVAHAWVEVDGVPLREDPGAFTRLAAAGSAGGWRIVVAERDTTG